MRQQISKGPGSKAGRTQRTKPGRALSPRQIEALAAVAQGEPVVGPEHRTMKILIARSLVWRDGQHVTAAGWIALRRAGFRIEEVPASSEVRDFAADRLARELDGEADRMLQEAARLREAARLIRGGSPAR